MGWAIGPASSVNWALLTKFTSDIRLTGWEFKSDENSCGKPPNQPATKYKLGHDECITSAMGSTKMMITTTSMQTIRKTIQGKYSHLISEDSQSFFQCKLKPISASHSVPCPVMEVFVCNYTLY